ncbi:hypothetical protein NDU88_000798 [Pleurodeles waltl]|uniref:Secreted protein n=1 Tax=Pleurodeles waltl TaxID=8319 RepID=A0AAV7MIQ2_PLEWA|nr:hypothetical protein NDU88_000798 [Pleurodeles waltl]
MSRLSRTGRGWLLSEVRGVRLLFVASAASAPCAVRGQMRTDAPGTRTGAPRERPWARITVPWETPWHRSWCLGEALAQIMVPGRGHGRASLCLVKALGADSGAQGEALGADHSAMGEDLAQIMVPRRGPGADQGALGEALGPDHGALVDALTDHGALGEAQTRSWCPGRDHRPRSWCPCRCSDTDHGALERPWGQIMVPGRGHGHRL